MSATNFAELVDDVFNYSVTTSEGVVSGSDGPLDELFGTDLPDDGVAIEWTSNPSQNIPDIEPLLNLAEREGLRLANRNIEFNQGGQTHQGYEEPSMKERLVFTTRD